MIVGFDISTRRIDWAWLNDDEPHRHYHDLAGPHVIDRVRCVRSLGLPPDMTEACIEYPYSVNRQTNASLMAIVGALTTRIYPEVRVAWVTSLDLRAACAAAANTKTAAHERILDLHPLARGWDEHALDALVTCQGWTTILSLQERDE